MTALAVLVFVFVIVRFLDIVLVGQTVLLPLALLPSMVKYLVPSKTNIALADEPEMVAFTPVAGLIVRVADDEAQAISGIKIGKVSAELL